MPVTKINNLTSREGKVAFRPLSSKLQARQQMSVNWSELTAHNWQQMLMKLIQQQISAEERLYWMLTFREWLEFVPKRWNEKEQEQSLFLMIQIAYDLCDWPMLTHCYQMLQRLPTSLVNLSLESLPSDVKTQLHSQQMSLVLQQAVAYWQMGQLIEARDFLRELLDGLPAEHPLVDFYCQIEQDVTRIPSDSEVLRQQDIILVPLEEQHLAGFSWVYQDSNIAKLCNLPEFDSDEQWFDWLAQDQMNARKQVFVINHLKWGLVGSVSIEVHDGVGFFYYWLGEDFQGGGIGPVAVNALLDWAVIDADMTCCYAKVFSHNLPSQKAMKKMGFVEVPFKIAAPSDDQIYFYRGPEKNITDWGKELVDLAAIIDIDSQILV